MAAVLQDSLSTLEVVAEIDRGLPVASAMELKDLAGLSNDQLAALLGMSPRTLARLDRKGHLDPIAGDRLYRALRVVAQAVGVLEDAGAAVQWLRTPQRALGNAVPLELLRSDAGARAVESLLGRMECGVYT